MVTVLDIIFGNVKSYSNILNIFYNQRKIAKYNFRQTKIGIKFIWKTNITYNNSDFLNIDDFSQFGAVILLQLQFTNNNHRENMSQRL